VIGEVTQGAMQDINQASPSKMTTPRPVYDIRPASARPPRRIVEDILAQEEEHADDMASILKDL
jgi:hypothetical protein